MNAPAIERGVDRNAHAELRRRLRRPSPAAFLLGAALVLAPWIGWLAITLPSRYLARHWDVAWAGFDAGLALLLALTGFAAHRRAVWLDRVAVAAATLLVADAWFDVTTSSGASLATAEALGVELPVALSCLSLAHSATSSQHARRPRTGSAALPTGSTSR